MFQGACLIRSECEPVNIHVYRRDDEMIRQHVEMYQRDLGR
jgi:hypothetical protein